jgi:hydroxypyruvate reductase
VRPLPDSVVGLQRQLEFEFQNILAAALAAVEPAEAVRRHVRLEHDVLVVDGQRCELSQYRRLVVVGAGKASAPMAAGIEDLLGNRLPVEGVVSVRYGHAVPTRHVRIREAGHPVPDAAGVSATGEIVAALDGATEEDLVVCLISGGGSALMTMPVEGVSLADLQRTTDALLRCGATINEINVVRKHLDAIKGGGLARLAAPARLLTLILSDVVGNPLDAIASGPTVPDTSTFADAAGVLDRYGLWSGVAEGVVTRIRAGVAGEVADTPRAGDPLFENTHTVVVGSNLQACEAAAAAARDLGMQAMVLTTFVEGEAREVGRVLAGVLREIDASGHPLGRPCCVVAGGETTVTVRGQGRGGRNQELALAAATPLRGVDGVLLASVGTDGSDGPTDAAGAWVDGWTLARAAARNLDAGAALAHNDSYTFFEALGGSHLIRTGPTQTNVNDLYVLLADSR